MEKLKLSFDELKERIFKSSAKSEYQQTSIVILRGIFENIVEENKETFA